MGPKRMRASHQWLKAGEVLGKPEWKEKPEWAVLQERSKHRHEIHAAIGEVTRLKPSAYWIESFEKAGIPCGPVYNVQEMFADPQVKHLGMATPVSSPVLGSTNLVASPLNFSGLDRGIRAPTPDAGTHTQEVLRWIGYSDEETRKLRAAGVV